LEGRSLNFKNMSFSKSGVIRKRSRFLGAVDGGAGPFHEERINDLVRAVTHQSENVLPADISDNYGGSGRTVSIEREGNKQKGMQEELDQQVAEENIHSGAPAIERGLPPCLRVKKEGDGDNSGGRRK